MYHMYPGSEFRVCVCVCVDIISQHVIGTQGSLVDWSHKPQQTQQIKIQGFAIRLRKFQLSRTNENTTHTDVSVRTDLCCGPTCVVLQNILEHMQNSLKA